MYPQLAGNESISIPAVPQIFAGSAEIVTNRAQGGTDVKLDALSVIALVADKIVRYNPSGNDGSEVAKGILAAPLDTTATGVAGAWAPYYTGGDFNYAVLKLATKVDAAVAATANTGKGTVGSLTAAVDAPSEVWTLTCTAASSGAGTFSVVGSVSGAAADATVGVAYNNGKIAFTIADGTPDFAEDDVFTIKVRQPTLSEVRAVFASHPGIKVSSVL